MNSSDPFIRRADLPRSDASPRLFVALGGVAAIILTFAAAASDIGGWKYATVAVIGMAFTVGCYAVLPGTASRREGEYAALPELEAEFLEEIDERLVALDEASEIFATSLSAADMFRLVSSRVNEMFPFSASALAVPNDNGEGLKFLHADGANAETIRGTEFHIQDGLAGRAISTGRIEIDNRLKADQSAFGSKRMAGFVSAVAIPLGDGPTSPVFQLFKSELVQSDDDTMKLLDGIREHVAPIFKSSLAFERSLSSALTDSLTGLPNERAFLMVLENQLAESIRHRDDRPLSVLSIDIRDFGAVNSMLGHSVGDRMLEFAGARIAETLRKMDFLARTVNDEFGVILPTASESVAFEIVERIKANFRDNEFEVIDGESVAISLNVGWATFWKDGETVDQLIRASQQRKRQVKSEVPTGVLWFPKQYVN